MPRQDITNKKFGKLVAVEDVTENGKDTRSWRCNCECGGSIIVRVSALNNGTASKCKSCYLKNKAELKKQKLDVSGQTFGNLTALYRIQNSLNYKWHCNLCGSETLEQQACFVKNGNTQSCGCLKVNLSEHAKQAYKSRRLDLQGKKFGFLTAIKYNIFVYPKSNTTPYSTWECLCDCGNTHIAKTKELIANEITSCGCKTPHMLSLAKGGTGVVGETLELQDAIRRCKQYKAFVKACLLRASGVSELSGNTGKLAVHHIHSVSDLIEKNKLTKLTYLQCSDLFNPTNGIVLTEEEHRKFHSIHGLKTLESDWTNFVVSN